jgi:hypothetical protein
VVEETLLESQTNNEMMATGILEMDVILLEQLKLDGLDQEEL